MCDIETFKNEEAMTRVGSQRHSKKKKPYRSGCVQEDGTSFEVPSNSLFQFNPLNAELNLICHLLALLGFHHFLHVSRIRVKSLTLRLLMSYVYMEHLFLMFLVHTQRRTTVGRTPLDE